jgi:two-component system response regulator
MDDVNAVEILLVEDSDDDAGMTVRALNKRNLANRLIRVEDGEQALNFIHCSGEFAGRANGHPKIILLDIKMPKMDGIEVLRRLKSDDRTKTIPVVMLTSSAEDLDVDACYRLGANGYLVKPVGFDKFAEVVSAAGFYWAVLNRAP